MNRTAKTLLVLALVGVVGMAFRVSWNALRDVAKTVGADATAAMLYPFVVDGLMALALVATLALTGDDRRFALRVLAGYALASLALNYVHGLVPEMHGGGQRMQLADWDPANWALVLLATSLPVGSIYFGSDLVAKVLHYRSTDQEESTETTANQSGSDLRKSAADAQSAVPDQSAPKTPDPVPTEAAPVRPVASPESARRRPTGRVPESARTPRPARNWDELLDEARKSTADWPEEQLTANAIRQAVRTSAANARKLRDALKAEREQGGPEAVAA